MNAPVAVASGRGTCPFCEAMCGVRFDFTDAGVDNVRGDHQDPLSRGYICPKARALGAIHRHPGRVTTPLRRTPEGWTPISWTVALHEISAKLASLQRAHGNQSVAFFTGNPNLHSYSAQLFEAEFSRCLATPNQFSTASMDHLPHLFAAFHMFGHQLMLPVPDVERTQFLLILGANPLVSNGSLLSAPGFGRRLKEILDRGGRVVVVDPRRTRTARLASQHLFIKPSTDAVLLLGLLNVIVDEGLFDAPSVAAVDGFAALKDLVASFPPAVAAACTGVPAETVRELARSFAGADSAVCYGRLGTCVQEFGALTSWLVNVLNLVTGNLDRPGGAMVSTPMVDLMSVASVLGMSGSYGQTRSRVRGLPGFSGFLPIAALAEEIETPGPGQVRGLVVSAGNPFISAPNAGRLRRAAESLELLVCIDVRFSETSAEADYILPATLPLERDYYDVVYRAFGARDTARYSTAVLEPPRSAEDDWRIYAKLGAAIARRRGGLRSRWSALRIRALGRIGPRRLLSLLIGIGPHGVLRRGLRRGWTLGRLLRSDQTIDLGPLQPRVGRWMRRRGRRVQLAPDICLADVPRLRARLNISDASGLESPADDGELLLIGRRVLRRKNSWVEHFGAGKRPEICALYVHPRDADRLNIASGSWAQVTSRVGSVTAPVVVTEDILEGVVSLPHGFPTRTGDPEHPTVNINTLTDDRHLDALSGTVSFSGVPVAVVRASQPLTESRTSASAAPSVVMSATSTRSAESPPVTASRSNAPGS